MTVQSADALEPATQVRQLTEALEYILDRHDGWSMLGSAKGTYTGGPVSRGSMSLYSSLFDRDEGRYLPFYNDEQDLQRQRILSRNLATFTSIAVGAMQALNVYVMGGEWSYDVQERPEFAHERDERLEGLIDAVQRTVDRFLERNDWVGDLDRELHDLTREDGESLVALYPAHGGDVDARRIEPDALRAPANARKLDQWLGFPARTRSGGDVTNWSFGVLTLYDERMGRIDHTRPAGYHIVHDDAGRDWDYLPSTPQPHLNDGKCGVLLKRNTIRTAKRGISDYWPVQVDLEREDQLSENITVGAAVQAAIAYIKQHAKGVSQSDASAAINDALDTFSQRLGDSQNNGDRKINRLRPGTVIDMSAGKEYKEGPGAAGSGRFLEVSQALKRRIGIRWLMPEYMISGDASNANFASTLVAESPFVKAREADQEQFAKGFERIVWRAVKIAHDAGHYRRFVSDFGELERLLELNVTPPPVATRDRTQLLSELTSLFDRKIVTANEVRSETRREELPELEGVTGSGAVQPGMMQFGGNQAGDSQQAAVEAALESVHTDDEARAILESLRR